MTKQKLELKNVKAKQFLPQDNKTIIIGSIIALFIAITPYLFYTYESAPNDSKIWDTFLFTYTVQGFEDANWFVWILTSKAIPLSLLLIWFFTCRHWWYHAILVPISMYTYQIISMFNDDKSYFDEFQLMHLIPIMAIIIPSIYLMRARIFNRINTVTKSMQDLEDELTFKPKTIWGKIKQYF